MSNKEWETGLRKNKYMCMLGMGSLIGREVLDLIEGNYFTVTGCAGCIQHGF